MALVSRGKSPGSVPAALAFHVLRDAFLQPDRALPARFLSDETMRQFVLEDARQLIGHAGQALHRNANAAVIERADPAGCARDVHERLIGVQDHADGFGRHVVQSGRDFVELGFECPRTSRASSGAAAPL